ncbi:probable serine/threonine-protein kinase DDB_G0293292 [Folsomia candida]|nr:probable serine/threonine-protein kinase DDB_G0293292 [Folsomia candida]
MQLCGENLRTWLNLVETKQNNLFIQRDQVEIISNLISGLEFLHMHNLMHRDLKPENIMFTEKGCKLPVKIGDFGLCRKISPEGTQTDSLSSYAGTRVYMAPECRTGQKDYSYPADIFSAGLIIWEVMQFVKYSLFERLVYDEEEKLVKSHPLAGEGIRAVIISMTKRKIQHRLPNLRRVRNYLQILEAQLAEKVVKVGSTQEFKSTLMKAVSGTSILLRDAIYKGPFSVNADKVVITGESMERTIFQCEGQNCVTFFENDCSISNVAMVSSRLNYGLEVIGNGNKVENVAFNSRKGLLISGNNNVVSNIKFSHCLEGLTIKGCDNKVDKVDLENIEIFGIKIQPQSSRNSVTNVRIIDTKLGILIGGSSNSLAHVSLVKNNQVEGKFRGIYLFSVGENNTIRGLSCTGYHSEEEDWGLIIRSRNTMVDHGDGVPVLVQASNATLTDVHSGGQVILVGTNAVQAKLIRCSGSKLLTHLPNFSMKGCDFESHLGLEIIEDVPLMKKWLDNSENDEILSYDFDSDDESVTSL